jgi:hypothetical protein
MPERHARADFFQRHNISPFVRWLAFYERPRISGAFILPQNGTSPANRSVRCALLNLQISFAKGLDYDAV